MKSETPEELFARLAREREQKPSKLRDGLTFAGVALLIVAVVGPVGYLTWWAVGGLQSKPAAALAQSDQLSAALGTTIQRLCQEQVRSQLKSPSTAQFVGEQQAVWNGRTWTLDGTVDAQNSFGAALRSSWTCTVRGDRISTAQASAELF